jgi:hypothetical protein
LENNRKPKKYGFSKLLNTIGGSPRASDAAGTPGESDTYKIKKAAAAAAAESTGQLPPLKRVNNEQEDEILNLI